MSKQPKVGDNLNLMKRFIVFFAVISMVLGSAMVSTATTIWGVASPRVTQGSPAEPDQLFTFDSTSPTNVSVIGSTNLPENLHFTGLDFDGSGNLFGYAVDFPTLTGAGLYSINKTTGAATFIGAGGLDSESSSSIDDLTYNPITGQMLGIGNTRISTSSDITNYYSIDLTSGFATKIGDITNQFLNPGGLATDATGDVFLFDSSSNFFMEIIGLNAVPLPNEVGFLSMGGPGTTIDWSGDGTWYWAGIENGTPFPSQFRTINSTSGVSTLVGTVGSTGFEFFGPHDIAIEPNIVPEPATALLFGLGLLGLAGMSRRKK